VVTEVPVCDVAVVGGGPAGLSASLQMVRSRFRVTILDSNRPRHAATLRSHGFLTRDGTPPLDLRRIGREEFEAYDTATFSQTIVESISRLAESEAQECGFEDGVGFRISGRKLRGRAHAEFIAARVLLAAGLHEQLPDLPMIRAFYGTALHSCILCDGYEKRNEALMLLGTSSDMFERALKVSRLSDDLIVFTNGSDAISDEQELRLNTLGVRVERRRIADLEGVRATFTGVRLEDGEVIARESGFVRPIWHARLDFLHDLAPRLSSSGFVEIDENRETSVQGIYAAGDIVPPGPEQLVVAAGDGARAAACIMRDLQLGRAFRKPAAL
jgi:thioredoxin reductase